MKFDKLRFTPYFHSTRLTKPGHDVSEDEARQIIDAPLDVDISYKGRLVHLGLTASGKNCHDSFVAQLFNSDRYWCGD